MNLKERIKKEESVLPLMQAGYSRTMANAWYGATSYDFRKNMAEFGPEALEYWHKKGYLASSIRRYNLIDNPETEYITDFEYLYMKPFNNSFSKWLEDIITTNRVLLPFGEHLREVYFSIIRRDGKTLILRVGQEDREYTVADIIELLREKGELELRPAFWESDRRRSLLSLGEDEETGEETLFSNGIKTNVKWLKGHIGKLTENYVISEPVSYTGSFEGGEVLDHSLKLWLANDTENGSAVLCAVMNVYYDNEDEETRASAVSLVDLDTGCFEFDDKVICIPYWEDIKEELCRISETIPQITFYTTNIVLDGKGGFRFLRFSCAPALPGVAFNDELNDYLKARYEKSFRKRTMKDHIKAIQDKAFMFEVNTRGRKGIRPFMYKTWRDTARSDLIHTKGVSLPQKLWAHKHGFFSWHLYQYGITKDNYLQFLSDYDYYWLNRINNDYQKWVNDKTTFRMIMEPFKEYVPQYYFSIFGRNGEPFFEKMWDCPEGISADLDGLAELLKQKGKLALKASAGTHGDGFYCLSYENNAICANGEPCGIEGLEKIIDDMQVFYIVTEYLEMHSALKKIYDKSVNTVRMMVINEHGYDPKIMQTYMRIGSEKTGFTDNVGYGGICVFVDKETGELYKPETIKDHVFYDCPLHPDTGTPISGFLPNWQLVRSKVLEISRYLCELEYLGFDIAITEGGFQILEINIHQDLHKVADFDPEIKAFFRRKLARKRAQYR